MFAETYFFKWGGVAGDTTAPTISSKLPAQGSTVTTATPTISASYSDPSGIDVASVHLLVDGADVTSSATVTTSGVSYTPPTALSNASHTVALQVEDTLHNPASATWSFTVSIAAQKQDATLTLSSSTTSTTVSTSFTLSGTLSVSKTGTVTLLWSINGSGFTFSDSMAMTNGQFSRSFGASGPGTWTFKVTWPGDSQYNSAESNVVTVAVQAAQPLAVTLTCTAASPTLAVGSTMTISGSMTPAASGKTITLYYTPPTGTAITRTATTNSQGQYQDMYQPQSEGLWSVTATFAGDSQYLAASSTPPATFNVTAAQPPKTGCIVATATYGSAMAPQVQALRDFRQNVALKTFAGSSFMAVFNEWYYSWSPPVASVIAPSEPIRAVMQVVLQPVLNILDVATFVNSALSFDGEFAIVSAGFAASALIGLVYFLPLTTLALFGAKRYRRDLSLPSASKALRYTAVPWLVSIALIAVAEVAMAPVLMMVATGAFVILTMALTVSTVSLWLVSFYRRG